MNLDSHATDHLLKLALLVLISYILFLKVKSSEIPQQKEYKYRCHDNQKKKVIMSNERFGFLCSCHYDNWPVFSHHHLRFAVCVLFHRRQKLVADRAHAATGGRCNRNRRQVRMRGCKAVCRLNLFKLLFDQDPVRTHGLKVTYPMRP